MGGRLHEHGSVVELAQHQSERDCAILEIDRPHAQLRLERASGLSGTQYGEGRRHDDDEGLRASDSCVSPCDDFLIIRFILRNDASGAELAPDTVEARLREAFVQHGIGEQRDAAFAMPSRSSGSHRNPPTPSSTTSGNPPTRDATTGTSQAIASSAARPKLSCADGRRKRSETDSSGTT